MKEDNDSSKYMEDDGNTFVKESVFSCIRPIGRNARLIVYNSSNITALEGGINRGSKIGGEVPVGCMIVFTSDTFHASVKLYERRDGVYPAHLWFFAYIVEYNYVSLSEDVSKMLIANKCDVNCPICEIIPNENIHYKRHIIRYADTQCSIDKFQIGKVLLGDL